MTKQEFFFDDPAQVAAYCRENWPEDCEHIIRVADQVCRNQFLFDLKADLERTWEVVDFGGGPVDWEYRPGEDAEFSFQFDRHRFFITLGQAYWLTGDEKYVRQFITLLEGWLERVKHTREAEQSTWRSLEAGFRGEFWVKAIQYFKDSPLVTRELMDSFYESLAEQGEYLMQMHSSYRYISNWGVIENHGLFEIGVAMPDEERRSRFIQTALEHLAVTARMQIMGDGVQWEQSASYHNEVLHCYEDVLILAFRNQIPLPQGFAETVRKMAWADVAWKKPDHHQFMTGDSDDTDIRDFISVAAWLFRDPGLKGAGFPKLDFESVWDVGIVGAREYEQLESRMPEFTSVALEDSGNYYLRDGWGEDGNLLHMHCGTLGAGHGHSDKLHLDLVIGGEDVLTDAGRYQYVPGPDRYAFKNPDAHNTITVDGKYFTICKDSWECSKLSQPVKQSYKLLEEYEFIQGGHLGYMDQGVYINRKVVHIKPDLYIIMDEMYAEGDHTYEQYWNFSEGGRVEAVSDQRFLFQGQRAVAEFLFLTPGSVSRLGSSRISRYYNYCQSRPAIKTQVEGHGFTSLLTVIHGRKAGEEGSLQAVRSPVRSALKNIEYPYSMAEAVKIQRDQKEYVVIFCHQEVNSPTNLEEADGCIGFGNVIVFDKSRENLVGTVLHY